jgi:hypothetical protein
VHHFVLALGIGLIVPLGANAGAPGGPATINFDENGHATAVFTGGTDTLPFSLAPLTYHLGAVGLSTMPGEIRLLEPDTGDLSDLLFFPGNGDVQVYSALNPGDSNPDLADVATFPTITTTAPIIQLIENAPGDFYNTNTTLPDSPLTEALPPSGPEGSINGMFGYSPASGGGFPGAAPPGQPGITYNFTSEVPEPASVALVGLVSLIVLRRRAHTAGHAES